jgi:glutamate-ammonia-ligase adenylyltransferase
MTAKSDLDLMTLYAADDPAGMSSVKAGAPRASTPASPSA